MTNQPPLPPNGPYPQYGHPQYGHPPVGPGMQPPVPPAKQRKKWPWIVGIVVVVVIIAAAMSGGDDDKSTDKTAKSAATVSQRADTATAVPDDETNEKSDKKSKDAGLNTPVRDGKFEFTVTGVEKGVPSVGDNPYLTEQAQGQFVILSVTVKNIGKKPQSFSPTAQKLTDSEDRTFEPDTTAQIALGGSDITVWDNINPGNAVDVKLVFDMPKGAVPAAVELHDSMFSNGASVDLA
ncbi:MULTISPECIES: DUF4352 domain-containing protein [Gordonia]|uniref:DUF4352 domain-containing protein n=1 Tax=Gordonia sihwensis NBRC 108236 TaxID=1223544 RepID=L7LJ45_9ACTN|nr:MULTISPECIES: DUF4352 domain-containing protein [Gordonia]AUH70403.1 DUF4352 domain-containing protein [Gordonia sp. YC-JH1]GAC61150.1 hypothetical protein GSI01S_15_00190 [Gordonia sihwensis NBRC 108236]